MIVKSTDPQTIHKFDNGYGASVISDGYGSEEGRFELAVLKFQPAGDYFLTYETTVTDDVLGWLTEEEVSETLKSIESLTESEVALNKALRAVESASDSLQDASRALEKALGKKSDA